MNFPDGLLAPLPDRWSCLPLLFLYSVNPIRLVRVAFRIVTRHAASRCNGDKLSVTEFIDMATDLLVHRLRWAAVAAIQDRRGGADPSCRRRRPIAHHRQQSFNSNRGMGARQIAQIEHGLRSTRRITDCPFFHIAIFISVLLPLC